HADRRELLGADELRLSLLEVLVHLPRLGCRAAQVLLRLLPARDVAEVPDAAVELAVGSFDRGAEAVERAPVLQVDLVAALLVRMLVEVADAVEELSRVLELLEDRLERA